ncbi:uncharacterized protein CC84DRAFT_1263347 [Paraphaeosphaeria sporulosa]|uniref:Uncharacterized protein n=1 Tax=Paraphaeosphaeria sporulosa TaxID=1460663 RepID=A0A177BYD0_9PLEO|nr:uncharacterized protein CC84DRAFT_1263347 [Paraphaeosphaeria sporulosa]OAG00363.1 hypothetical protein CC84DRAFT_1263347 [Paraphaeosphaeria sporulosa]
MAELVNMNQFMTAIVIVVGYLSIQGEIFGYRKTAKSFFVSATILSFMLYLLNLMVFLLRHYLRGKGAPTRILTRQLDQFLLDRENNGKVNGHSLVSGLMLVQENCRDAQLN